MFLAKLSSGRDDGVLVSTIPYLLFPNLIYPRGPREICAHFTCRIISEE